MSQQFEQPDQPPHVHASQVIETPAPQRPSTVTAASVVSLGVAAISGLAGIGSLMAVIRTFSRAGTIDTGITVYMLSGPLWLLMLTAGTLTCGVAILNGHKLMRLGVFFFLGALALLSLSRTIGDLAGLPFSTVAVDFRMPTMFNLVICALSATAVILLITPDASQWFRAKTPADTVDPAGSRPREAVLGSVLLFIAAGIAIVGLITDMTGWVDDLDSGNPVGLIVASLLAELPALACLVAAATGVFLGRDLARVAACAASGYLVYSAAAAITQLPAVLGQAGNVDATYLTFLGFALGAAVASVLALVQLSKAPVVRWFETPGSP